MDTLTDFRGHVIKVGTPVGYPVTVYGHSPAMKTGIVLEILDNPLRVKVQPGETSARGRNWTDRPRTLRGATVNNLVVLPRTNHEASHAE